MHADLARELGQGGRCDELREQPIARRLEPARHWAHRLGQRIAQPADRRVHVRGALRRRQAKCLDQALAVALGGGGIERARGWPIYLVHGALDWMFPVQTARMAREALEGAGARVVYREIADLSHTYPRDENPRILDWLLGPLTQTAEAPRSG